LGLASSRIAGLGEGDSGLSKHIFSRLGDLLAAARVLRYGLSLSLDYDCFYIFFFVITFALMIEEDLELDAD